MIPTAKDFTEYTQTWQAVGVKNIESSWNWKIVKELMVKFAQLHVEAALKAASEKAKIEREYLGFGKLGAYSIKKSSILNSYPLKNIK